MKTIFLDRDGTLNHDPGYLNDPENFFLKDHVIEGLSLLKNAGFHFIVITNQSGVSRRLITEKQLEAIHQKMISIFSRYGIKIKKIYHCPDLNERSARRKPNPGMIQEALNEFPIDLKQSYIIGDSLRDIQTGAKWNIPGIWLNSSSVDLHGSDFPRNLKYSVDDLFKAACFILREEYRKSWTPKIYYKRERSFQENIRRIRSENKKIVFTNGCFDILHAGHLEYLGQTSQLADFLVIGLNSDKSVKKIKGNDRPIFNEIERSTKLAHIFCVDMVVIFDEDLPIELIREIKPDFYSKGGDYKKEKLPERSVLEKIGSEIFILPYIKGNSTTNIIERVKSL